MSGHKQGLYPDKRAKDFTEIIRNLKHLFRAYLKPKQLDYAFRKLKVLSENGQQKEGDLTYKNFEKNVDLDDWSLMMSMREIDTKQHCKNN